MASYLTGQTGSSFFGHSARGRKELDTTRTVWIWTVSFRLFPNVALCATPTFWTQAFKAAYEAHVAERAKEGIPPLALDASQVR